MNIHIEIVIVNYNPVKEMPSLIDSIPWPKQSEKFVIRFLNVPHELHNFYQKPETRKTVPLFEFIAKNIGIRRARGEYILSTNADILFDPGILLRFGLGKLEKNRYYRANRADFYNNVNFDFENPLKTLLEIRKNVFKIFLKGYEYNIQEGSFSVAGLFSRRAKNAMKIWKDFQLLKMEKLANKFSIPLLYENLAQKYHLHASGDFMLMHREHWHFLRAYPENCYSAVHTDSLFTIQSACSGLREVIVSAPVYHQNHNRPDSHYLKDNVDFSNMYERLVREGGKMDKEKKPIIYNEENWGAGNVIINETIF